MKQSQGAPFKMIQFYKTCIVSSLDTENCEPEIGIFNCMIFNMSMFGIQTIKIICHFTLNSFKLIRIDMFQQTVSVTKLYLYGIEEVHKVVLKMDRVFHTYDAGNLLFGIFSICLFRGPNAYCNL